MFRKYIADKKIIYYQLKTLKQMSSLRPKFPFRGQGLNIVLAQPPV